MLVLSRRQEQRISFPTLDISVEILRVQGGTVRLGIQAPPDVLVLRDELANTAEIKANPPRHKTLAHRLRGRLNTANMALYVVQKQLQAGLSRDAEKSLNHALSELDRLERDLGGVPTETRRDRPIEALLVEDNLNESSLLTDYLRLSGVKVQTASDGSDALDYLQTHEQPDVVLLDMRMPRCDGPTTVSRIRSNPALERLRIFAVTGAEPSEFNIPVGPGGVDAWFSKPLNPARLVETLNRTVLVG